MCMGKREPVRREETSYAGYEGACLLPPPFPEVRELTGYSWKDSLPHPITAGTDKDHP